MPDLADNFPDVDYPIHDYVRLLARERDNNTCQNCGVKWDGKYHRFPVHHLNGLCGKVKTGEDIIEHLELLVTLCTKCHFNHPEYARSREDRQRVGRLNKGRPNYGTRYKWGANK